MFRCSNALLAATMLALLPALAAAQPNAPPPEPAWLGLAKALAWPVTAVLIATGFYRPLSAFVSALGSRVTKLSVFKVELELVPAKPATATPLFDKIRTTKEAILSDSGVALAGQIQLSDPADYATIDIASGGEWFTSRLYIASVMIPRMRGVQAFVFVEHANSTNRRFLAVAPAATLRWALAEQYPWLEFAWVQANWGLYAAAGSAAADNEMPMTGLNGVIDPKLANQLVNLFISSLQGSFPKGPPFKPDEWTELGNGVFERASWVTSDLLRALLPADCFDAWTGDLRDVPRNQRMRAVLRRNSDFVAQTIGNREFDRLFDRQAMLTDIAASLAEESD